MSCPSLLDLPPELHLAVCQHLTSFGDINSYARTNHGLYALLDPQLYALDARPYHVWALYWAAETGSVGTARRALKAGTPVNSTSGRPSLFSDRDLRHGATPLVVAAVFGRVGVISLLLQAGADASLADDNDLTALHYAAMCGHDSVVRVLLHHSKTELNRLTTSRSLPLSSAIDQGYVAVVKVLLACKELDLTMDGFTGDIFLKQAAKQGSETIYNMILNHNGIGPALDVDVLFVLGSPSVAEVAERLIAAGADLENVRHHVWEPLRTTIAFRSDFVSSLLGRHQDNVAVTPLSLACRMGNAHFVRVLLKHGADAKGKEGSERAPYLHFAISQGNLEIVQLLLRHGADYTTSSGHEWTLQGTPLHEACRWGDVKTVRFFLHHGVDVNAKTDSHQTPLRYACFGEDRQADRFEIVQALLDAGADPNPSVTHLSQDPLYTACLNSLADIAELLILRGAEYSLTRYPDHTPLHAACAAGDERAVRLLLERGLDPAAETSRGETPLLLACCHGGTVNAPNPGRAKIIEMLLEKGADPNDEKTGPGRITPLFILCKTNAGNVEGVRLLLEAGADPRISLLDGRTPLHAACLSNNYACAKLLLEYGSDVSAVCDDLRTPLHMACISELNYRVVGLLLEYGADATAVTRDGQWGLDWACRAGHVAVASMLIFHGAPLTLGLLHHAVTCKNERLVELLLAEGMDPGAVEVGGRTPLHCAARSGNVRIVEILLITGRVNISVRDDKGETALNYARSMKHDCVVRCLESFTYSS